MTTTTGRILVVVAIVLSLGHHADHVIRGNHIGWPLVEAVTPFTASLVVYPVIVLGLVRSAAGRPAHGYWTVVAGSGVLFLTATHLGPSPVEPPADIIGEYPTPLAGWVAFGWLLALIAVLAVLAGYEGRLWWRGRRTPPAGRARSRAT